VAGVQRSTIASDSLPENGEVSAVVLRPENIRFAANEGAVSNGFKATVKELIYRGPTRQILLETPFGKLNVLTMDGQAGLEVGKVVGCCVAADEIVVLAGGEF
jgi:ABC-type Fe3+/spermidine/putrescine transport system ATPase subunit